MKNYLQSDDNINFPAPYDVASGAGCLIGYLFGIAAGAALTGEPVSLKRRGVFKGVPKTSAQAWTVGDKIYWNDTSKEFTTTASGNTLVGAAYASAVNPSETGDVLLDGAVR